jgi:hypothetical protein
VISILARLATQIGDAMSVSQVASSDRIIDPMIALPAARCRRPHDVIVAWFAASHLDDRENESCRRTKMRSEADTSSEVIARFALRTIVMLAFAAFAGVGLQKALQRRFGCRRSSA